MKRLGLALALLGAAAIARAQPPSGSGSGADAGASGGSAETDAGMPWGTVPGAPPLPSFLQDTTGPRRQDDRPPPTPAQLAALREMEAEVDRFTRAGAAYRETVLSVVRREFQIQRRQRSLAFSRQIREEERAQSQAREDAIRLFERFIERYPDDPTYTPDAMFRLAELYYERSYEAHLAQDPGAGEAADDAAPDFTPSLQLYQRLVRTFPAYRRIDAVYYLIGYCLNEMGREREARVAWLNLVCANRYRYDAEALAREAENQALSTESEDAGVRHPALTLDAPRPGASAATIRVGDDPYADCQPVRPDAQFVSEAWFRIGEHHFEDYGDPNGVALAIAAYSRILANPDDDNYGLALYKVAWAYYRANRFPEAIQRFSQVVDWSDAQQGGRVQAGAQLRPEALLYLAISFAYDDWNDNQVPDPEEGGPRGIQRLQDPNLMPQDRPWTPEVYFQLGNVYFDENKLPEAIEVWRLALQRWPLHHRVPEIRHMIARAYTRNAEIERALQEQASMAELGEGSPWWNANMDHPAAQRLAEQYAENALINSALHYHQQAQTLRRNCVEQRNVQLCQQARVAYAAAANAYRGYLQRYPNNPQAYELRYNLADALFWSESYEEAAREYALVRDSNLDDRYLSESARRVVEALKAILDAEVQAGRLQVRDAPPEPQGEPPTVTPVAMPELVQRIAQAREIYLNRVSERQDTERVRPAYDYNNTMLLYWYGYWPQARARLERIFEERCSGPYADETGRVAWLSLRNMALQMRDDALVERLGQRLRERQCTFAAGVQASTVDCRRPENADEPQCLVLGDLNAIRYRRALDVYRQAEQGTGDEQRRLYEQAATMLVQAVNETPDDPQAPLALEYAATALERTSRFESAARLYQRIVDEVGPRRAGSPEEQQRLDRIVGNAYFRIAYNANRFFDFDRALDSYRTLADSPRFASSRDERIQEWRQDALINSAIILENLQQYARAADYYRRAAEVTRDAAVRRNATYRIAEMAYKRRDWNAAVAAMRDFINRYQSDPEAGELVVQAYWRIAQIRQQQRNQREYRTALNDVVSAFARSGQPAGSVAAEYAAEARFRLADESIASFESFTVDPGRAPDMPRYVEKLRRILDEGSRRAQELVAGYEPVLAYRRPTWTIAAYVRQGRVYEVLLRAMVGSRFTMPDDLAGRLRRVSPEQREEIRAQVEAQIQDAINSMVNPIECFAIARYALAARAARAGSIDDEYTRLAIDRLQNYGEERIAQCVAEAAARDPTFGAYTPGEFTRAPRGLSVPLREGVGPPPLAQ
ncbi:MAG: tetratricopeptide repeat protein [Myxococcota bacterium]|nr:tetratricopeptide repeat protein [Myxococcota bacterium]MDW8362673.1 tetratricopeptide repeat protein [Myxococcales bacterium]